jgi:hypothetical protein
MNEPTDEKTETPPKKLAPAAPKPPPKPAPASSAPAQVLDKIEMKETPRSIPVRLMRLVNRGAKVAGFGSTDVVEAKKKNDGSGWAIDFFPQLRHFRVAYTEPARPDRNKTTMIHETRVDTWEPAVE